jgi:hypothetical protein
MAHHMILRWCLITTTRLKKTQYRQSSCKYIYASHEDSQLLVNYSVFKTNA